MYSTAWWRWKTARCGPDANPENCEQDIVGDYIKQSVGSVPANGGAVDANFVYVQTVFNF